jgi:hypothetical protein
VSNQVEIIYSSSRNSKETGEIIRISPRKNARGIRPLCSKTTDNSINILIMLTKTKRAQRINFTHLANNFLHAIPFTNVNNHQKLFVNFPVLINIVYYWLTEFPFHRWLSSK